MKFPYIIISLAWALSIVFFDLPCSELIGVSLFLFCFISINAYKFLNLNSALNIFLQIATLASLILGCNITYLSLTSSFKFYDAVKLLLYFVWPFSLLFPSLCESNKTLESSIILFSVTVPFCFLLNLVSFKKINFNFKSDKKQIPFAFDLINELLCSLNIVAGYLVTIENLYSYSNPSFGFISLTVLICVTIPSFILFFIFNHFISTRKFGGLESIFIVCSGIIPYFVAGYILFKNGKGIKYR